MPEIFVGETFCAVFRKVSGSEKLYGSERRGIKIFRQIVFVSQGRRLSKLNTFVLRLRKLPVEKKIMDRKGVSRFSVQELLSHSAKKYRRRPLCAVFQNISGSEKRYG